MKDIQAYQNRDLESLIAVVNSTTEIDDAIQQVKQVLALKTVLESCNAFHENAIKYARLEAAALIRCVELGGLDKLRGHQRQTAMWLYGLNETERERYANMCAEGLTIDQVWKREIRSNEITLEAMRELDAVRSSLIEDLKTDGIIDLSSKKIRPLAQVSPSLARDWLDGTRRALREAGGMGVGNGNGTYVLRSSPHKEKILEAILTRWASVEADMDSIVSIAKSTGITVPYCDLESSISQCCRSASESYKIHFLLGLVRAGVLEESDELFEKIGNTEAMLEVDQMRNLLKCERSRAIKQMYTNLMAKEE